MYYQSAEPDRSPHISRRTEIISTPTRIWCVSSPHQQLMDERTDTFRTIIFRGLVGWLAGWLAIAVSWYRIICIEAAAAAEVAQCVDGGPPPHPPLSTSIEAS